LSLVAAGNTKNAIIHCNGTTKECLATEYTIPFLGPVLFAPKRLIFEFKPSLKDSSQAFKERHYEMG